MYEPYADYFRQVERRYGLTPNILMAIRQGETGGMTPYQAARASSSAGARGYMQFMPETGARYGLRSPEDFQDPYKSIDAAGQYVRDLQRMFPDRPDLVAAAYNAGENRPSLKRGQVPNIPETQSYVPRVMNALQQLNAQQAGGQGGVTQPTQAQQPSGPPLQPMPQQSRYPSVQMPAGQQQMPTNATGGLQQGEVGSQTQNILQKIFSGKGSGSNKGMDAYNQLNVPPPRQDQVSMMSPGYGDMSMLRAGSAGLGNPGYEDMSETAPRGLFALASLLRSFSRR